ncbi:hypothetical protein [Micromonospora sp. NPDC005172]|uniref:hypothetical protein n=1 Tax=Micromonospora sp. NPDC005172 TaxID=3156867 RepID=UPI0033BD109D
MARSRPGSDADRRSSQAAVVTVTAAPNAPACTCAGDLPCVSPDTYVTADNEGDWLTCPTCPTCDQKTVMVTPGASVAGLLGDHAAHTCSRELL